MAFYFFMPMPKGRGMAQCPPPKYATAAITQRSISLVAITGNS